jgi:protocatechuate 3,4-dioxygenase, alpha subunit
MPRRHPPEARLQATASQTVGPYFAIGLDPLLRADLAPTGVPGRRVTIAGRVLDGDGAPVTDALLELWQANADGRYAHPDDLQDRAVDPRFHGFGRVATNAAGDFRFATLVPGRVPGPGGMLQAPHIVVGVFMRGLLKQLVTRIYFPDDTANAGDPILALVPAARRGTLIARPEPAGGFTWNVILQGDGETVFFDC